MQESGEMYLETILILSRKAAVVRAVDVSETMGFSKPSVSRAMGLLKESGMIEVSNSGSITLTDEGQARAQHIYERHTTLTELFLRLGVDAKTAAADACRVEHYISDATFNAVKRFVEGTSEKAGPQGADIR